MKFIVKNTESWNPLSAKYVKLLLESEEFKNKATYSSFFRFSDPLFEIDLDSMDQLAALKKLVNKEIIICDTDTNHVTEPDGKELENPEGIPALTLEIYDGYRE